MSETKENTTFSINLHLHKDEGTKTLTKTFIPWGVMKEAVAFTENFDNKNMNQEDVDGLSMLVVKIFGVEVTVDDLNKYADLGEMVEIMLAIFERANKSMSTFTGNPTRRMG